MLNTLGLANKVKLHLTYSVIWSNITTVVVDQPTKHAAQNEKLEQFGSGVATPTSKTYVLKGENPKSGEVEYVLAISGRKKLTLENLDLLFKGIEEAEHKQFESIDKILMAIVDSDGSILFYYVHRGVKNVNS
ncbi:hypothetical protein PICMEDRAFT_128365 [Pichia membranifaciens NRRL Y-2026]|uniref:tRNA-splicing endonuclease subunit Sen15 domain-containing protein n=1 Tax=Pichia membranifaciens NRRL Y-2026 TaxID=763406 RepID=A0A1E3NJM4_9ASCO|nr:hypothetical protein PICMEDRAFT_128365 [Pichia membranifaciens NRRL Y-2026]ODQ46329.1 hypothetical protein PICMEDRAFT_128365 [Pichia membranifaciens NRRL Y-2026]